VAQYATRKAEFTRLMEKVEQSDSNNNKSARQAALAELGSFMAKYPNAKPHQYTDPDTYIWGQTRHIIGQWPFSIEDGTLDRAEGSAVAEGEAEEAGRRVILINRV
jgi:hypothetical protein